jgi:uncharacterized membrane protein YidH (DUF202 family)
MRDTFLTVLSTVLSVIVVGVGIFLIVLFLQQEFTFLFFIVGLVGNAGLKSKNNNL